jgi:hypothetical protein
MRRSTSARLGTPEVASTCSTEQAPTAHPNSTCSAAGTGCASATDKKPAMVASPEPVVPWCGGGGRLNREHQRKAYSNHGHCATLTTTGKTGCRKVSSRELISTTPLSPILTNTFAAPIWRHIRASASPSSCLFAIPVSETKGYVAQHACFACILPNMKRSSSIDGTK